jgi:tripartite-type tricarboxylate transporter receptor subunit TctC
MLESDDMEPAIARTSAPRRHFCGATLALAGAGIGLGMVGRSVASARAVRLIAQEPGAQTDSIARLLLPTLSAALKQDIVVENHGGAGGRIAARIVATAAPDGETIGIGGANNLVLAGLLGRDIGYDPTRDFTHICAVARVPFAVAVRASLEIHSVDALVRHARANPGKLTFGSAGVGGSSHLAIEAIAQHFQLDLLHVPFRGSSLATHEVIAERIDLVATDLNRVLPLAKAGKLRLLAATGATRAKLAPGLPTLHEQGLGGFYLDPWYGLYAPKRIDQALAARWQAAMQEAFLDRATQTRAEAAGIELVQPQSGTLLTWIETDLNRFRTLARRLELQSVQ